jgi:hypothetical protein
VVAARFPEDALRGLRGLAGAADDQLGWVVSTNVANLFEAGYHDEVLEALMGWTRSKRPERVLNGVLCFLLLARSARTNIPPGGERWPTLLWLARDDDRRRERTAALWRRALDAAAAVDASLRVLGGWVRLADRDTVLVQPLRVVLDGMARAGRERARLRYALRRLAEDPRRPSEAAARLLEGFDDGRPAA